MRFGVIGADKESGNDVEVVLVASSQAEAEAEACKRGILVSAIKTVAEPEGDLIALVDDDDHRPVSTGTRNGSVVAAVSPGASAAGKTSPGMITVNASSPADTAHTGAGKIPEGQAGVTAMEYHILMNQSLYLLECAVNKQLRDGWEPTGGLAVGISNNAQVFYQSLIRKKK